MLLTLAVGALLALIEQLPGPLPLAYYCLEPSDLPDSLRLVSVAVATERGGLLLVHWSVLAK